MIIEQAVLEWLTAADMEGIGTDVYCGTPIDPPDEYVLIERTAGSSQNKVRTAMVAVQSVSTESLLRAAEINEDVLDAMELFGEESSAVYSCRLNSNYNYTNTQTKEYRYQAVFDLVY